jgi:hypothetical protein
MEVSLTGRLSTVDLLVLTSLEQLTLILKILFSFFTKQATLIRRSTVQSVPPQLVFPGPLVVLSINCSTTSEQYQVTYKLHFVL